MKKIAIVNIKNKEASSGGPSGYLYNLYLGMQDKPNCPDFIYLLDSAKNSTIKSTKSLKNFCMSLREFLYFFKLGSIFEKKLEDKINTYDIIHAHTGEVVLYLRWFCKFKGKIIFTPHRPESMREELLDLIRKKKDGKYYLLGKWYDYLEEQSYKLADMYIFPSISAKLIYNSFPGFSKAAEGKKVEYLYTGIQKKIVTIDRESYREKYNISEDSFVIGYIGRHNKIKGYDRLINLYKEIANKNVEFLLAGNINNQEYPEEKRWHELGYINDAQNLMNASDVIIIPNRNTYFDLVILEALSLGKIVITSNTGGNIDISKDTSALILFDNKDEHTLTKCVEDIMNMSMQERKKLELEAVEFFEKYCSAKVFAKNYLQIIEKVK